MRALAEGKLHKLLGLLEEKGLDGALIAHPPNIQYLTGAGVGGAILIASKHSASTLLVPPLEYHRAMRDARAENLEIRPYYKYVLREVSLPGLIEAGLPEAVEKVVKETGLRRMGSDLSVIPESQASRLREKLGDKLGMDLSRDISMLRAVKDPDELEAITRAVRITEGALEKTRELLEEGLSESKLAGMLENEARRRGAEEHAFPIIVAYTENAAYPHVSPSSRRLRSGDLVLIDMGVRVDGYCSDMTRTWGYDDVPRSARRVYEAVVEALMEAADAIAPGVKALDVDSRAREILGRHGLSGFFIHSLGHGVGVDVHEAPRLSPGSNDILEEGMVITLEPGVYVHGSFGIRVEDMVLVTERGARMLTSLRRDLL